MSYKIDLEQIMSRGGQTNFSTMLLELCFKADRVNLEKLRLGFPNCVETVQHYQHTGEILDLEID